MKTRLLAAAVLAVLALAPAMAGAQEAPARPGQITGPPTKTTFVQLAGRANAVVVQPVTPVPGKTRIALVIVHPEHSNAFNYFTGRELAKYGYTAMMINTYGPEESYEEFIPGIAAGIKALRAMPGIEKVVLAGHSTGGPELTSYQDVAENGAKACQDPQRVLKCDAKGLEGLPKADGVMMIDTHDGAVERTIALNPAVGAHDGQLKTPALDMFDPKNGFDPKTKGAKYTPEFQKKYLAAQRVRVNQVIDEAKARLALIQAGKGVFQDDEPFVVAGSDLHINGARLDLADKTILSRTHGQHMLLKADGTRPVQIIPQVTAPNAQPEDQNRLADTVQNITVKAYLSFQALPLGPDYNLTADNVYGVSWRGTANSVPGNVSGIHAPTLFLVSSCAPHLVFSEIAFDRSAAADKAFVGLEGANHGLMPCRPEYGDTYKRAFDFIDSWLQKPGRF